MSQRIYSEKEVAQLLKRTAEMQRTTGSSHGSGLTLDELETVAAEAGLDPQLLRMAAEEMHQPAGGQLLMSSDTTTTHNLVDRWLGGSISEETWEDVVAMLRYRFDTDLGSSLGMPGYGLSKTESTGRTREWRHTSLSGVETRLLVRETNQGHRVQMSQRVGWASAIVESVLYGSIIGVLVGMIGVAASPVVILDVLIMALALIASIGMVYVADTTWRKKKHRELEGLADKVVQALDPVGSGVTAPRTRETRGTSESRAAERSGDAMRAEQGSTERGDAERNSAERNSAERSSAEQGSAEPGSSERSSADPTSDNRADLEANPPTRIDSSITAAYSAASDVAAKGAGTLLDLEQDIDDVPESESDRQKNLRSRT